MSTPLTVEDVMDLIHFWRDVDWAFEQLPKDEWMEGSERVTKVAADRHAAALTMRAAIAALIEERDAARRALAEVMLPLETLAMTECDEGLVATFKSRVLAPIMRSAVRDAVTVGRAALFGEARLGSGGAR